MTWCSIVPPYVLAAMAQSNDVVVAHAAQRTLAFDAQHRRARAQGITHSIVPNDVPEAAADLPEGTARRSIFDADQSVQLPGVLVQREGDTIPIDDAVTGAYANLGAAWALWQQAFERDSVDGAGMPLRASVHYGVNYDNAFWDGSQMVFGDGDGVMFGSFAESADVLGHELTHGLVQHTAGLHYQGQAGALNEHLSDVGGALVAQYVARQDVTAADWLIGAGLLRPGINGVALRSLKAPGTAYDDVRLGGKDPQPAHFDNYVTTDLDDGGVHVNSGIPNRAFYLVATAIGGYAWQDAGRIWFDAITGDIAADCDFADFAELTVAAAAARFGADSRQAAAVAAAWHQVGVRPTDDAGLASAPVLTDTDVLEPASLDAGDSPVSPSDAGPAASTGGPAEAPSEDEPVVELHPRVLPLGRVQVRRSGGLAGVGQEVILEVPTMEEPHASAWRSFLVSPRARELAVQQPLRQPDSYLYTVRCTLPKVDVHVGQLQLTDEEAHLFNSALRLGVSLGGRSEPAVEAADAPSAAVEPEPAVGAADAPQAPPMADEQQQNE